MSETNLNSRRETIKKLIGTLEQTLPYFERPAHVLARSYGPPGKWTLQELLVHVSDTETVLLERLRRIVAERPALFSAFDENLWAANLNYKSRNLKIAQRQYEAARHSVIELAEMLPESADALEGTHSEAGKQTFAQVLAKIASHNEHHLQQIIAINENRTWGT